MILAFLGFTITQVQVYGSMILCFNHHSQRYLSYSVESYTKEMGTLQQLKIRHIVYQDPVQYKTNSDKI